MLQLTNCGRRAECSVSNVSGITRLPLRRDAVGNAGNKHDGQLVGQLVYRSFQDASDRSVALLAPPEQLLGTTLTASHNPRTNPSNGYISRNPSVGPLGSLTGTDYNDDFSEFVSIGRLRRRLPVAAKIALVTAALTMAVGASPTPPGASAFLIKCVSTTGTSSIRIGR